MATDHLDSDEPFAPDAGPLKAAIRRAFADEPIPAGLTERVGGRLAAQRGAPPPAPAPAAPALAPSASAPASSLPLRPRRRLWMMTASAIAAMLLLAVGVMVYRTMQSPAEPEQPGLLAGMAGDLIAVHEHCLREGHRHPPVAGQDPADPLPRQAQALARAVGVEHVRVPERIGGFDLASCANCPVARRRTVHLIYARDGRPALDNAFSVFALPAGPEADAGAAAVRTDRRDLTSLASFRRGDTQYVLVARVEPARIRQLAEELMQDQSRAATGPLPPARRLARGGAGRI